MERVVTFENPESQEEVKMREANKGLMIQEKPLRMGKRPITNANKLVIIRRQIQKGIKKRKGDSSRERKRQGAYPKSE